MNSKSKEVGVEGKTQNDLPKSVRRVATNLLNQLLTDALDLGMQVKQAHWNVKGPNFIALHEFFDEVREECDDFIDDLAERAVALGGVARGTVQVVARDTRLAAYPLDAHAGSEHITRLSAALAEFGKLIRTAIGTAEKAGDANSADLLTSVSRRVDKLLWKVEAHGWTET